MAKSEAILNGDSPLRDPNAEVEKTVTKDRKTGLVTTAVHSSAGE